MSKKSKPQKKKFPMFKTVEQMAQISGIGENTLRSLMDNKQLAYIQVGNRRLIADEAMWEWYHDNKIEVKKGETSWQSPQEKSKISVIKPAN